MNKEEFIRRFKEDDRDEVLGLFNKFDLAYNRDIPIFSAKFYTPNIWKVLVEDIKIKDFKIESYGVFNEAERRVISFNNQYYIEYPTKVLKIQNPSKFKKLQHKDYLGSIMSLGIDRNKIGDLIVREDCCYVATFSDIAEYILNNLEKISNVNCKISVLEGNIEEVKHEFSEEIINIQSIRLDSIVSKITRKSRAAAEELISRGDVLINYSVYRDKSKEVKSKDRITVRRYGKFILGDIVGSSKSGKLKVVIKKYT